MTGNRLLLHVLRLVRDYFIIKKSEKSYFTKISQISRFLPI